MMTQPWTRKIIFIAFIGFMSILVPVAEGFKDDFEDGKLDGWTIAHGQWVVDAGAVITAGGTLFRTKVHDADLELRCRVKLHTCWGEAGIVVRYDNGKGCAGVIGEAPDRGKHIGCGMLVGNFEMQVALQQDVFRRRLGRLRGVVPLEWYTLKLSARQGRITLSVDEINQQPLELACEQRIGKVALYASNGARFDDFIVVEGAAVQPKSRLVTVWAQLKNSANISVP